ncbi:hypothetical protein BDV10DRAFT_154927 [Aspergillus recurvatus]
MRLVDTACTSYSGPRYMLLVFDTRFYLPRSREQPISNSPTPRGRNGPPKSGGSIIPINVSSRSYYGFTKQHWAWKGERSWCFQHAHRFFMRRENLGRDKKIRLKKKDETRRRRRQRGER